MSAVRRTGGLGRGMASLIPMNDAVADTLFSRGPSATDVLAPTSDLVPVDGARLEEIRVDQVRPNPRQPRRDFDEAATAELEQSVHLHGVLQPIVVRPVTDGGWIRYELVMGERRLRAAQAVGQPLIPAVVKDTADDQMLQHALLENLHRLDLNALEEASAYQQLIADFGISQEQLAEKVGRSRPAVANTIRLLGLPESVQRRVAAGVIPPAVARALLPLPTTEAVERMADRIVREELTQRDVETAVATELGRVRRPYSRGRGSQQLTEIADRLGARFDTRVQVSMGARSGRIVIDFGSADDLQRILGQLGEERWERPELREPA